jgi:hypothetical protein
MKRNYRGISFHYYGKDRRGVTRWGGGLDNLPLWLTKGFLGYSVIACVIGLLAVFWQLFIRYSPPLNVAILVFLLHFAIFGLIGIWMERLRSKIAGLSSEEETCARLGLDKDELQRLAKEKGILPVYNINDRDYYNLAELTDALLLLRPASAPDSEQLLRPAGDTRTAPELLLRPADAQKDDPSA